MHLCPCIIRNNYSKYTNNLQEAGGRGGDEEIRLEEMFPSNEVNYNNTEFLLEKHNSSIFLIKDD